MTPELFIASKASEAIKALYNADIEPSALQVSVTRKEFTGDFTLVVFPLLRLCLVLAYPVFKGSGVLLRSLRLVQRCGDLIPALLKHPRDHLAGDEKQGAEEDDEVDDGK